MPDKASGSHRDGAMGDRKELLPCVWTCNLCKATTRQRSMRKLSEWRSNSHRRHRYLATIWKRVASNIQSIRKSSGHQLAFFLDQQQQKKSRGCYAS